MNFIIYFLLISGLSILITKSNPATTGATIKKDVQNFIENGQSMHEYPVWLLKDGLLGETKLSLVWKGIYENEAIAVKIAANETSYIHEVCGFDALNATMDPNIESLGIPRIYFSVRFMHQYYAIAMTLFDGTLFDRMRKQREQDKKISELSILLIFRRAVEILEYLTERKVIHNDIKPGNIFLRGPDVFLSDFNGASVNGEVSKRHTKTYASSNLYLGQPRVAMDDFESLVFSLWHVAGIPKDKPLGFHSKPQPEGQTLAICKRKGTAKQKMMEKCMQFKDPIVREAFQLICVEEMLKEKSVPDYKLIVKILTDAITKMHGNSGTPQFEWLTDESSSSA